jgi:hypothetical protein
VLLVREAFHLKAREGSKRLKDEQRETRYLVLESKGSKTLSEIEDIRRRKDSRRTGLTALNGASRLIEGINPSEGDLTVSSASLGAIEAIF